MFDIGIKTPLTPDGLCGYDKNGQLWVWEKTGEGITSGHMIRDPRGEKCKICLQGWVLTSESMGDQYKDRHDEWLHYSCYIRYLSMQDQDLFHNSLVAARIRFDNLHQIDSQYWVNDKHWHARKWYWTTALDRHIKITMGSRKRVFSISFEAVDHEFSGPSVNCAKMEFEKENVTKEFSAGMLLIHAWGRENVTEYVKRLSNVLRLDQPEKVMA